MLDKKIALEKAIAERDKREAKAAEANSKAESISNVNGTENSDPQAIKNAQRTVKQAENANKSLERGNNNIAKIEAEIKGLETKLDNAHYGVKLTEK